MLFLNLIWLFKFLQTLYFQVLCIIYKVYSIGFKETEILKNRKKIEKRIGMYFNKLIFLYCDVFHIIS